MTPRNLSRLATGLLGYNLFVVVWGALVRATGSGAGCGEHWPSCNGQIIPLNPTLETAIEFIHRQTSGIDAIWLLAVWVLVRRAHAAGTPARRAANASLFFMGTEALLGAGLVLLGLTDKNQSPMRAVAMSVHLLNTFTLLAMLTRLVQVLRGAAPVRWSGQGAAGLLAGLGLVALPILGVTGAIAALGDTLFPAKSLAEGMAQDANPAAHFLLQLRVAHPVLALAELLVMGAVAGGLATLRPTPQVQRAATAVGCLFLLQLGLGVLNLVLLAPTWLQLTHLLTADLLWLSLVWMVGEALGQPVPAPEAALAAAA
jgi:cytochrome c oxidase assembly protein subunit 15